MEIRPARRDDIPALVSLRRAFTYEDPPPSAEPREGYEEACARFLDEAIGGEGWTIWVAEDGGEVVAHALVELVAKVPRPVQSPSRFGYLTNVYALPAYRGSGVGSDLLRAVQEWARAAELEFLIVWPTPASRRFYSRLGFDATDEPMIWRS